MTLFASAGSTLTSQPRPGLVESLVGSLVAVGILAVIAVAITMLLKRLFSALDTEPPRFDSYWGGLGRGPGGWSVNRSFVLSVFTLLAFVAFIAVAVHVVRPPLPEKAPEKAAEKTADKASEKPPTKAAEPPDGKDKTPAPGPPR